MKTFTLRANRPLVIDEGDGWKVSFDAGSVAQDVEVRAGVLGPLTPSGHTLVVWSSMFRLGFRSDEALLKPVRVEIAFTPGDVRMAADCKLLRNIRKPQYPDPLPWRPNDPDYPDPLPWQPEPTSAAQASPYLVVGTPSTLGTFVAGYKTA